MEADKVAKNVDQVTLKGQSEQGNTASPTVGDDRRESTNDTFIETPVARPSSSLNEPANSTFGLPAVFHETQDQAANGSLTPYSTYNSHPSSLDSSTSGDLVSPEVKLADPTSPSLEYQRTLLEPSMRRGISLRIKPRKIENDYAPPTKPESNGDLPALDSTGSLEHGRFATSSTAGEIVTPKGSQLSLNFAVPGPSGGNGPTSVEPVREKTTSMSSDLSDMTVTFGHSKRSKQRVL